MARGMLITHRRANRRLRKANTITEDGRCIHFCNSVDGAGWVDRARSPISLLMALSKGLVKSTHAKPVKPGSNLHGSKRMRMIRLPFARDFVHSSFTGREAIEAFETTNRIVFALCTPSSS